MLVVPVPQRVPQMAGRNAVKWFLLICGVLLLLWVVAPFLPLLLAVTLLLVWIVLFGSLFID